MLPQIRFTQAGEAQATVALIKRQTDIAITVLPILPLQRAIGRAGKLAPPVPINPPTPHIRVMAAQPTLARIRGTRVIVITVARMLQPPRDTSEAGKFAQPVTISLLTPLIRATAVQPIPARGLAIRNTI